MDLNAWHALHFMYPAWLLAAVPLLLLAAWLARRRRAGGWPALIDAELMPALQLRAGGGGPSPAWLVGAAWLLAVLALAGPSWRRGVDTAWRLPPAWVVVLDLSPSMAATDVAPDRVTRARYVIDDILAGAQDARIGLVAFAGEPYAVVPLTADGATVHELLQPLAPGLMPAAGDRMAPALDMAGRLMQSAAAGRGRRHVIVLSDGSADSGLAARAAQRLRQRGITVDVIGVGTQIGAPEPDGHGGFVRDAHGQAVLTRLAGAPLQRIAAAGGGRYLPFNQATALIRSLQTASAPGLDAGARSGPSLRITRWLNDGIWLLLPLLAVAALLARRGWI